MNYTESAKILEEIKKVKNILVSCHRSPDLDCIGSSLALQELLITMGKKTNIVCPNYIPEKYKFLPNSQNIKKVDFLNFDFNKWDLLIILESSRWEVLTNLKNFPEPTIKTIVIDHHATNNGFGNINLLDKKISSVAEMLYLIFNDWNVDISKNIAQNLLAGIITDTGVFAYPEVTSRTFEVAKELIDLGADKNEIIFNVYRNVSFDEIKFWGEVIKGMQIDSTNHFVWSAVPFEVFEEFKSPVTGKEMAANLFFHNVKETFFGMIMVEQEKNILSVNFRSRKNIDVSKIAQELGGGGHMEASGAKIQGLPFTEAVEKVLQTARKFARQK